jgi:hypothetical protein
MAPDVDAVALDAVPVAVPVAATTTRLEPAPVRRWAQPMASMAQSEWVYARHPTWRPAASPTIRGPGTVHSAALQAPAVAAVSELMAVASMPLERRSASAERVVPAVQVTRALASPASLAR